MSRTLEDVKDYLVKQLAELSDSDLDGDELARKVERAKTTSLLAATYINAVRTEIDALRLADDIGMLPTAVAPGQQVRQVTGQKPRLIAGG